MGHWSWLNTWLSYSDMNRELSVILKKHFLRWKSWQNQFLESTIPFGPSQKEADRCGTLSSVILKAGSLGDSKCL